MRIPKPIRSMRISSCILARGRGLSALGLVCLAPFGCYDDSPCDAGQVVRNGQCYAAAGAGGSGGSSGGAPVAGADDGGGSGAPAGIDAEFGQPCTDTVASSDCGGKAPICAPLPAGNACTQAFCQDGEANAGVCPADWPCLKFGENPSACLKL